MIERTEAAVLFETNKPLRFLNLRLPKLGPGQVLVEVAYSGICHSQLLEVLGHRGKDPYLPHTLGHEGSGVVIGLGNAVKKVKEGQKVVLCWIKGLGREAPQTIYESSEGRVNSGSISTFMRHAVISENRLIPIPDKMPLREAALLGCAVPTGAGIVLNQLQMQPRSSVAVFGMGGIGLSAILALKMIQTTAIIAIDLFDHKLQQAKKIGASQCVNSLREDVLKTIFQLTEGRGVDYAIECAGKKETMETAFRCVRDNGGICVLAGNLPKGETISIDPFELIRGKRIVGTWGGQAKPDRDIPKYAKLFLSHKMDLASLITHEYRLEDVNVALEDLKNGTIGRGLLRF